MVRITEGEFTDIVLKFMSYFDNKDYELDKTFRKNGFTPTMCYELSDHIMSYVEGNYNVQVNFNASVTKTINESISEVMDSNNILI